MLINHLFSAIDVCNIAQNSPNGARIVLFPEIQVRASLQLGTPISAVGSLAELLCGKDSVCYLHTNNRTVLFLTQAGFIIPFDTPYALFIDWNGFYPSTNVFVREFQSCKQNLAQSTSPLQLNEIYHRINHRREYSSNSSVIFIELFFEFHRIQRTSNSSLIFNEFVSDFHHAESSATSNA